MLKQDCFCSVELFVKNSNFSLYFVAISAFSCNQLVDFPQEICLGDVAQSSVASFCDVVVLLLDCEFGKSFPVGFGLWSEGEWLEDLNGMVKTFIL